MEWRDSKIYPSRKSHTVICHKSAVRSCSVPAASQSRQLEDSSHSIPAAGQSARMTPRPPGPRGLLGVASRSVVMLRPLLSGHCCLRRASRRVIASLRKTRDTCFCEDVSRAPPRVSLGPTCQAQGSLHRATGRERNFHVSPAYPESKPAYCQSSGSE